MKNRPRSTATTVVRCARCGKDHPDITFERLDRPSEIGNFLFTHWTTCPTNGQPIVMGKQAMPESLVEIIEADAIEDNIKDNE